MDLQRHQVNPGTGWPGIDPVFSPCLDSLGRWSCPCFDPQLQALLRRSGQERHLIMAWLEDLICAIVPLPAHEEAGLLAEASLEENQDPELAVILSTKAHRLNRFKQAAFGMQVEEHYSRTKRERDRIIYSMLRCRDQGRIQELSLAIREGEIDFSMAAIRYSEGPESAQGGRIGPISPQLGHPELNQRLELANEGELIGPFPVADQYVLLRLDTRITTRLDDTTQPQLLDELYHDWLQRQTDVLLSGGSIEPIEYLPIP